VSEWRGIRTVVKAYRSVDIWFEDGPAQQRFDIFGRPAWQNVSGLDSFDLNLYVWQYDGRALPQGSASC